MLRDTRNIDEFKAIAMGQIHRNGLDKLLEYLDKTDFFCAPASTMFHGNYAGGLVDHSLNVYHTLRADPRAAEYNDETVAIVALFHDLCKVNTYETWFRNVKNEDTGRWEQKECYRVNDKLPFGHGEKSVWLVTTFMRLNIEEAMAIRWHMGAFTDGVDTRALNEAFERYPLAQLLHQADDWASKRLDQKVG
nr:MAG TPA: Putative helicase [Caudoviricetes sp.]